MPSRDDLRLTIPSRGEDVVAWSTEVIGGPTGRYAAIGRQGISYAVIVLSSLASVFVALGVVQKEYCVRNGWGAPDSLWRACYSDLPVAAGQTGGPWSPGSSGQSQPVLTAVLQWLLRVILPNETGVAAQRTYFTAGAVIIALLVAATVVATMSAMRGTPWLAAHVALSPVLVTAALVSFDMFGVALATIGFALWVRGRPLSAGLLLGLGVMARTYPLVLILAIVLVALRDRRSAELGRMLLGVAAACAVCLGGALAVGGHPLRVYSNWYDQGAGFGSPWQVMGLLKMPLSAHTSSILAMLGWLAALLVGVYLTRRPRHLTPLAPLALTMLVIVMCTGKSFPVQQAVWLLPLLALVAMRWREHLIWATVEIVYFVMTWMYVAASSDPAKGLAPEGYLVFSLVRLVAWAAIGWIGWESAEQLEDFRDPDGAVAAEEQLRRELSTGDSEFVGGRA
ncbi:glycosyltransferase 87 family protein [Calidifontibacter terrae]